MRIIARITTLGVLLFASSAAGGAELVKYSVVDGGIQQPLTTTPGDPSNGRLVAINRKQGNCLACHVLPIPQEAFQGEIGPPLTSVATRLSAAEIRLQVVDSKAANPDSLMPAFYRVDGLHKVKKEFKGKPILDAQQVEDVIAYLLTLKE